MVKLQKPNPKTLNQGVHKGKKSNNFKKEKLTEAKKAIPATNVTVKKEKIKLIGKTINEASAVSLKPKKNVVKIKKATGAKPTQKEVPIVKKIDKKKSQLKEAVVETKVEPKQGAKKIHEVDVDQIPPQQKQEKQKKKKAPAAPAKDKQTEIVNKKAPETKAKNEVVASAAPAKAKHSKVNNKATAAIATENVAAGARTAQGKKKKQGKGKKKPVAPEAIFEAVPFDDDKFKAIVNLENMKKVCTALKTMVEKEVKDKKNSIFEDYRYLLNVCSFKIPNCPKRIVKLNLAHSLVDPNEDDVVIIVPDLQRGAKVDYEPTIQHYEDLFRGYRFKIVPFAQLRQECTTFEAKRKFASTYDYFLCDGRIVGHVVGFGGSYFQKSRTTFHAVRLNNNKTYKKDIETALKRTAYKQIQKGDLISIPVGNHRFTVDQLVDNIQLVVDQLKALYPGGLGNIRNMHVKIDITGTSSLPLYASLAAPPAETPNVIGIREKRMLKLKREANEVLSQFNMSKTGEFVKLDKAQAERKRKIQEARRALLTEDGLAGAENENDEEEIPTKKTKKSKKEKAKADEKENTSDEEDNDEEERDEVAVADNDEDNNEDDEDNDEDEADDDEDEADDDEDEADDDNAVDAGSDDEE